jgi:phosphate transport system substrate-binding protein
MKEAKRALVMLALAVTVGCSSNLTPATPPPHEVVALRIYSTEDSFPLLQSLSLGFASQYPNIPIESNFYNQNILLEKLANGEIDYFLSHHFPAENDSEYWAAPLAQDALTVIVNSANRLTSLTIEDLRRIYRGYLTNWEEAGGEDLPITIYSRDEGAGIRLEFERLVMGQERTSPNALVLPSTQAVLEQVAVDLGAIAYLPLSLLDEEEGVQMVQIEGIPPSLENIEANRYPLRMSVYIIGLHEPVDNYLAFIAWAQGNAGQAALSEQYAPLPP